eukprot:TRINITY_DN702_c1_g1_i4.p1 TRINITY_DN702_c1_g1~~TRINITY_DN702_c1_g1_i4.p1  ORF type:complete len:187 (-),score=14.35 TRINITY_DN702_c1_g1_i4:262-822(-)
MSLRIRVQVVANNVQRYVELDRAKPDFNLLKEQTQRKTKQQGQWYLRRANNKAVNNDADLLEAIVECESTPGTHFLELTVAGGRAPTVPLSKPAQPTSYTPTSTYTPPPVVSLPLPTQVAPVKLTGPGSFRVFSVPGDAHSTEEKPKIVASSEVTFFFLNRNHNYDQYLGNPLRIFTCSVFEQCNY